MKEITIEPILDKHFKKNEILTMQQLYHLVENYQKKHPDVYVEYNRDSLHTIIEFNKDKYYWDNQYEVIRRQELISCPCCETRFRLYPNSKKYFAVLAFITENEEKRNTL